MKFALLLVWLALLPALAPASDAGNCQPGYFARLTQRYFPSFSGQLKSSSPVARQVQRLAERKFSFHPLKSRVQQQGWMEWKQFDVPERALLESLPKLSAEERAELIPLVRSVQPEDTDAKRFRKLVLLGLYDRTAWGGLTTAIYEGNLHGHLAANYLPALSRNMPVDLRDEFLRALGDRYHGLTKERQGKSAELAPKRLGDLFFKHLLRGDRVIQEELRKGRTAREAFAAYVAKVQEYIPGDDHYSASHTLGLLEEVQKTLRKKLQKGAVTPMGDEPVLWVGGSLSNGRATYLESDIDIGTNVELLDHVRVEIDRSIKDYVRATQPDSGVHASFKRGLEGLFWTKIHPVTFRIRRDRIDMVLVNPNGEIDIRQIR